MLFFALDHLRAAWYNAPIGCEGEQLLIHARFSREGLATGWKPPGTRENIRSGAAAVNPSKRCRMPALRETRAVLINERIPLKLGGTACAYHAPWHFYAMGVFDYRRKMHMDIRENLAQIGEELRKELESADALQSLEQLRVKVLGKKGSLTALLRGMGSLSPEERPKMGQMINEAREKLTTLLDEKQQELAAKEKEIRLAAEAIDVTEPRDLPEIGAEHPMNLVLSEVLDCFTSMGFSVVEGPEVELDLYNFELLNVPKNHPARDAQDTFYIDDNVVLRSQTSPVQARTMLTQKPPIRIVCPGRVFRADEVDATHSPVFHQIEGLVIDKDVTMADLKGTLDAFAKRLYGSDIDVRFRPSFFPFTEPSAEVDLTCMNCHGKGCRVCKGTGWIEVLGCGMVNPKVLEMCGIDSTVYSGFAFGIGVERITMLRYGIKDMRLLYEGDLRFLKQFR